MPSHPRFVAIEGPPGAGVGCLAERFAHVEHARFIRDPTNENPFLEGFSRDPRRFAFQAQLFFLLARYRQQIDLAQESLFERGGVVVDYHFARDRLWAEITLSPDELALYQRIHLLLGKRVPKPDLVVYLTARPEILRARLMRRVKTTDRIVEAGRIDEIVQAMSSFFFRYEDSPLLVVNTSEIENVEETDYLDDIITVIRRTRAGTHHYVPGGHG